MAKKKEVVQEVSPETDVSDISAEKLATQQENELRYEIERLQDKIEKLGVSRNNDNATGKIVLRLPSSLWDVFGSPEVHVLFTTDKDTVKAILNTLHDWREKVILPLLEEYKEEVPSATLTQPAGKSFSLTDKQIAYAMRVAQEAGYDDEDEIYKMLDDMTSQGDFDDFLKEMKGAVRKDGVACPYCGKICRVPKNWRGTKESFYKMIREKGCYQCRFGGDK